VQAAPLLCAGLIGYRTLSMAGDAKRIGSIVSVANLTREDGLAFMRLAAEIPLEIETTCYPLSEANRALADLREGRSSGAAVLTIR